MNYLFDTNIFIRSKNEMPEDTWPTFWMRIAELIRDGKIFTSEKVKEEIERGNDELTCWMKENATSGFIVLSTEMCLENTLRCRTGLKVPIGSGRQHWMILQESLMPILSQRLLLKAGRLSLMKRRIRTVASV